MRRDELRQKKEQKRHLLAEMRSLSNVVSDEQRDFTAEERQQFDRLGDEVSAINAALDAEAETRHLEGSDEPWAPTGDGGRSSYAEFRNASRVGIGDMTYDATFWKWFTTADPGEIHPDWAIDLRALSKASGASGAYLVPQDVAAQILSAARAAGPLATLSRELNTTAGEQFTLPVATPHGVASWLAESGAYTVSDETFVNVVLNAYKAATLEVVSEELLQDSGVDLSSYLGTELGRRIGQLEETAFATGDGTGKPMGVSTSGNGITTTTLAAGSVATLSYPNLLAALYSLPLQYRQNASLVVADSVARQLYTMVDSQSRPIWNVNVAATGPDTFLGYGVYVSPDLAAVGANSRSMVFGDFQQGYVVRRVSGVAMQRLNELYAANGQIGFRAYERVDGRPALVDALRVIAYAAT